MKIICRDLSYAFMGLLSGLVMNGVATVFLRRLKLRWIHLLNKSFKGKFIRIEY